MDKMHVERLHRAAGPLWSCLIRCRVTGKLKSVCIPDCGIRSGLTTSEEQEEILFFTLLSVFWTNIDWGNSCFWSLLPTRFKSLQSWCESVDGVYICTLLYVPFLIRRALFWGEGFREDTSLQSRGHGNLHRWFRFNGPVLMVGLFSTDFACPGLNKWICK